MSRRAWRTIIEAHDHRGARSSRRMIIEAHDHSVGARLATLRDAVWARAQNARGDTSAAAAEELADEISESTEEIYANLSSVAPME